MAVIARLTTWNSGDVLTASDLNDEFDNIVDDYNGGITNANVAAAAAIAYSKLALSGSILNADINAAAAIASSKLALGITGAVVGTTDTQTLTNKTLTKPTMNGSVHPITVATYAATTTFSMAASNHHLLTLLGNPTLAVSNVTSGQGFIVHIRQGAGANVVSWFAGIKWAGGSAPTLTAGATKTDSFGFIYDGTSYLGYILGQNL